MMTDTAKDSSLAEDSCSGHLVKVIVQEYMQYKQPT